MLRGIAAVDVVKDSYVSCKNAPHFLRRLNWHLSLRTSGKKVLKAEYISSEESSPETDDVFVKPIPWRSVLVSNFFEDLDQKNLEKKTSQANRQRKVRKISMIVSEVFH